MLQAEVLVLTGWHCCCSKQAMAPAPGNLAVAPEAAKAPNPFDNMELNSVGLPIKQGLYDPAYEKDACGVGFVVNIDGEASPKVNYYYQWKQN